MDDFVPGYVGLTALGSGSGGNAYVLHSPHGNYMVDAGFSRKELCCRMEKCGIAPESIRAVIISHEHGDHVKGCRVFCNKFNIPAYMAGAVADYLDRRNELPENVVEFLPGSGFELPGVSVMPFSISHDAKDPVGFKFMVQESKIALATDLGCLEKHIIKHLHNADILVLEANYDLKMLLESDRSNELKHRIRGRGGHLDNRTAAQCLREVLGPRTRSLLLAHISSECNNRELLHSVIEQELAALERTDIQWRLLEQDVPDVGCYAQ